ncbi:MAG TPA: tRNA (adenosine(37)-N6)-threonylcarbamoyltransferase complex ATPase subunit type 1 TsaE [Balneolaceae bacterium]
MKEILKEFTSHSPEETLILGKEFAETLERGDVVCLKGELGAGKTHFVKGMAKAFGIDPADVTSPTFTLIHEYAGVKNLYHFDCYRMKSPQEALEIGVEEYFYGEGVCIVEWPERIHSLIPSEAIWISIQVPDVKTRKFVISKKGL